MGQRLTEKIFNLNKGAKVIQDEGRVADQMFRVRPAGRPEDCEGVISHKGTKTRRERGMEFQVHGSQFTVGKKST
jgi:hypothetical protein